MLNDVGLYVACNCPILDKTAEVHWNADNRIQNIHFGRYIIGYTFRNHI